MDTVSTPIRRQLGTIMVESALITQEQLTVALEEQRRTSQPLGAVLIDLRLASPGAIANALAEQHGGLLKTEYGVSAGLARPETPTVQLDPIADRDATIAALLEDVDGLQKMVDIGREHFAAAARRYDQLFAELRAVTAERDALVARLAVPTA